MTETIFVIGGCRSGKSSHALELAERLPGEKRFIATCIPYDDEMKARVDNHQKTRSRQWNTMEAPVDLAGAITENATASGVVLADCMTLWISNLIMENRSGQEIVQEIDRLCHAIRNAPGTVILVSNEVGMGIVPENSMARMFRDYAGLANQKVAATVTRVVWMVAGIPVKVKP